MASSEYCVFGLGLGTDDLRYIGWTQQSLVDEKEQIFCDLVKKQLPKWIEEAIECGKVSIFEIESAPSIDDAISNADSLCRYFNSLGLDVSTGR